MNEQIVENADKQKSATDTREVYSCDQRSDALIQDQVIGQRCSKNLVKRLALTVEVSIVIPLASHGF